MSIVETPSYPDVAAPQALPTMSWLASDVASSNGRVLGLDTLPPTHQRVYRRKPINVITEWALTTAPGLSLLWTLIMSVSIGVWIAMWLFLPTTAFSVVVGLPIIVGSLIAAWGYRSEVAPRRHLSFRVSRVFRV